MNTIKRFLLTVILLLLTGHVVLAFEYNGLKYSKTGDYTCRVARNAGISGNISIPDKVHYVWTDNGYVTHDDILTVTSIGNSAFQDCSGLTGVVIPNSVTTIMGAAFSGCAGLTSIVIPNSVTSIEYSTFSGCTGLMSCQIGNSVTTIGEGAFKECTALTDITIPNSVIIIGNSAFSYCSSLQSCAIGNSVTSIGDYAFNECGKLASVSMGNGVKEIGWYAFYHCSSLTSINISHSLTTIGEGAFSGCTKLTSIALPQSVTTIGDAAFSSCSSLTSINIPDGVTEIGRAMFRLCHSLTSITIPNGVTFIGDVAFEQCRSLANIRIPDAVTSIGNWAFNGCQSLTSVTIGSLVTGIGSYAFENCRALSEIFCRIQDPRVVTMGDMVFHYVKPDICTLYVPEGTEELYRNAPQWKAFFILEVEAQIVKRYEKGFGTADDFGKNREVTGITADGLAQMKIIFKEEITSVKSWTLNTKVNGVDTTDVKLVGKFGDLEEMDFEGQKRYGMIYTSPEDILDPDVNSSFNMEVTLKVTDEENVHHKAHFDIEVMRPGVILLHGLLSDNGCFSGLKSHLNTATYRDEQVLNGDYRGSHAQSFVNNTYVNNVVGRHMKELFERLAKSGVVSGRYDLVGHSMGGILSRMYAQEVNPDAVNRIITLDTPHSGSQLANLRDPVVDGLTGLSLISPALMTSVEMLRSQLEGNGNLAAIENLAPGSDAIARLNGPNMQNAVRIPVHAIVSVFRDEQQGETDGDGLHQASATSSIGLIAVYDFLSSSQAENSSLSRQHFFNTLFNGESDGVVSYKSQAGGCYGKWMTLETDAYRGKLGADSWAHHCKTNKWTRTYNNIDSLLRLPTSASAFRPSGFHPEQISSLKHGAPLPKLQPAGSGTSIDLQVERLATDTTVLQIHVNRSSDVVRHMVYTFTGNDQIIFSLDEQDCRFQVPENYHGKLDIFVLGRTANGGLVADEEVLDNGFIQGDVNADGAMNVSDVTTLVNMILGLLPTDKSTADVNNDGRVNVSDITALINLLLGIH